MDGVYHWANEISNKRATLVASNIIRSEILECTLAQAQKDKFLNFMKCSNVAEAVPTNRIMELVHEIRNHYQSLKLAGDPLRTVDTPDAIHLATGIFFSYDELQTFDQNDNQPRGRRALIPLSGNVAGKYNLVICKPQSPNLGLFP